MKPKKWNKTAADTILYRVAPFHRDPESAAKNLADLPDEHLKNLAARLDEGEKVAQRVVAGNQVELQHLESELASLAKHLANRHTGRTEQRLRQSDTEKPSGTSVLLGSLRGLLIPPYQWSEVLPEVAAVPCRGPIVRTAPPMVVPTVTARFDSATIAREAVNVGVPRGTLTDPRSNGEVGYSHTLPESQALDCLCFVGHQLAGYRPDVVVSLDRGGRMVGRFLESAFREAHGFVHLHLNRTADGSFVIINAAPKGRHPRRRTKILLVDDIVRSGATIRNAMTQLREVNPGAEIRSIAMLGAAPGKASIGSETLYTAYITNDVGVRLPWNNSADQFAETPDEFIFGARAGVGTSLRINKENFQRAYDRLSELVILDGPGR